MHVVRRIDPLCNSIGSESSAIAGQKPHRSARIFGNTTAFVFVNMTFLVANDLAARLHMHIDGNLVGLCTGTAKKRGFFAKKLSAVCFECKNRWVFLENVVANSCIGHGVAHFLTWLRNGITA